MIKQASLLFLAILFVLPGVSAQVVVLGHNASFELLEGRVQVVETMQFLNPEKSDVHTFDDDQTLIRRGASEISVSGMPSSVSDDIITLEFSKSPIFRTAVENSKTVTISYYTEGFTSELVLKGGDSAQVFTGNILPPVPIGLEPGATNLKISAGIGLQFGPVLPDAEIAGDSLIYRVSAEERKTFPAFNVDIQYGGFETLALANIESAKDTLDSAEEKAADADFAISNAGVYGANTSKAELDLTEARSLINESHGYITVSQALLKSGETYDAYRLSNTSVNMAKGALQKASDSVREANLQLQQALNEKISQLENMTTTTEPAPTVTASPTETPAPANETAPTPTPEPTPLPPGLTLPLAPPADTQQTSDSRLSLTLIGVMAMILIIVGATAAVSGRRRRPRPKHPAVTDFRSISDLKKKSYKGFEEKVVDVKKETNIAGEIRKLMADKKKFELGIENLNKKERSGEINEKLYKTERRRFESEIRKLEKKIKSLEAELPVKGGFDGQSISDKDRQK